MVSEESEHLWAARRDELNIGDHVSVICKPFLGRRSASLGAARAQPGGSGTVRRSRGGVPAV